MEWATLHGGPFFMDSISLLLKGLRGSLTQLVIYTNKKHPPVRGECSVMRLVVI